MKAQAVSSLAIAHLVDSGRLSYDDLVTKHWPEFGRNGKENVTVAMLIGHQAGLALYSKELTIGERFRSGEICQSFWSTLF